jgi:A118 family predicted phage portal protein
MRELPQDSKTPWIPLEWGPYYEQLAEHAAWYSGDTNQLVGFYSTNKHTPITNGRFWGENVMARDKRTVVHVPIAGDIATFSADMLFSEAPEMIIPEAHERNENNEIVKNARAQEADARLEQIIQQGDVISRLLEGGETAAAMGGCYLKPTWDQEISDVPILTIAQPDSAIPYFKHGILAGVIFHKVLVRDGQKVIRFLERYEKGGIDNGLYIGDDRTIGRRVPLTYLSETADIQPYINLHSDKLYTRYVPNKRPHKRFRGTALGMADLQGVESMMDSLDMTMTSWMRDIRLGRARLHVGDGMLKNDGDGNVSFDGGQEVYTELDIDPSMLEKTGAITATQFEIRTKEHMETATELAMKIYNNAGYSPQSFGLNVASQISTESHEIRERNTMITKQKKERFFKEAIADVLQMMLEIDNIQLGNRTPIEFRPNVSFADTLGHNIGAVASTVQMLKNAQSASIQTRVEMLHPDWSVEEIAAEVARIKEEEGGGANDPLQIGGKNYDV